MKNISVFLIIIFCICLWGGQYVLRHLWEPDEARYTYVAWEMNERGSWLVPYRNGETYAHKPPLMFWLIKAGTLFTGGQFNQVAGRLPSLLGAILALWSLTRLVSLWVNPATAWRAFFILCTSFLFWHKGGTGQIDMLLLGLELTALYLLFKSDENPSWKYSFPAFLFMGLAVLAKGPVGFIVPTGIYLAANFASGHGLNILRRHWFWGFPLALMVPGIWLLAAKISGAPPAYFNELLFDQNIGRAAGNFGGHSKPIYYYLQYLFMDFLPWTFFIPIALKSLWKKHHQDTLKKLLGWILFVVVFFSLCGGKRNLYILSVYPAAAVIIASAMPKMVFMSKKWQSGSAYPLIFIIMMLAICSLFLPFVIDLPVPTYPFAVTGIFLLAGGTGLLYLFRQSGLHGKWFSALIALFIGLEIIAGTIVMPELKLLKTPVALAQAANQVIPEKDPLLLFQTNGEIFSLYSRRMGLRIDNEMRLKQEMLKYKRGIAVFHEKTWARIKERFLQYGTSHPFQTGHKKMIWLEYDVSRFDSNHGH